MEKVFEPPPSAVFYQLGFLFLHGIARRWLGFTDLRDRAPDVLA